LKSTKRSFLTCGKPHAKRVWTSLLRSPACASSASMNPSPKRQAFILESYSVLLARVSGPSLTTAIVREGVLCGYRCTELPARGAELTPHMLLEDIYPVAAYYQDTWQEGIQSVRVAGLGTRLPEFVAPLEEEFRCEVRSLLQAGVAEGRIPSDARPMADRELDGLVGWMLHRG
jgi:hypothetical protein